MKSKKSIDPFVVFIVFMGLFACLLVANVIEVGARIKPDPVTIRTGEGHEYMIEVYGSGAAPVTYRATSYRITEQGIVFNDLRDGYARIINPNATTVITVVNGRVVLE